MAELKTKPEVQNEYVKTTYPARCGEKVKLVQLSSEHALPVQVVGDSKTLKIGNGIRRHDEIKAMAVHPHGVFVESVIKGIRRRIVITAPNISYYELADGE